MPSDELQIWQKDKIKTSQGYSIEFLVGNPNYEIFQNFMGNGKYRIQPIPHFMNAKQEMSIKIKNNEPPLLEIAYKLITFDPKITWRIGFEKINYDIYLSFDARKIVKGNEFAFSRINRIVDFGNIDYTYNLRSPSGKANYFSGWMKALNI